MAPLTQGQVSLEEVIQYVRSSGVTTSSATELRAEEFTQVVNSLIYDGEVEARTSLGTGKESEFAHVRTPYVYIYINMSGQLWSEREVSTC